MNPSSGKATPDRHKELSPLMPIAQTSIYPKPTYESTQLHARAGNAALAAAATSGIKEGHQSPLELQSTLGNGFAMHAAAVPSLNGEERQNHLSAFTPPSKVRVATRPHSVDSEVTKFRSGFAEGMRPSRESPTEVRQSVIRSDVPASRAAPKAPAMSTAEAQPGSTNLRIPSAPKARPAFVPAEQKAPEEKAEGAAGPPQMTKTGAPQAPDETAAKTSTEIGGQPQTKDKEPVGRRAANKPKAEAGVKGVVTPENATVKVGQAAAIAAPAAAPPIDTSSSEGLLQSLASTPPSAAAEAMAKASAAVPAIQAQEKAELEASFPQVKRSSGLPRKQEQKRNVPAELETGKPQELVEEKGREGKPPEVEHEVAQGPLPGKELSTEVREPPVEEKEEGSWWDQIFEQVQSFTAALPTRDPDVSTNAGPRPNVDLTGEANPGQSAQNQQASDENVNMQREGADGAIQQDFGENAIYPEVPEEILRPSYKPAASPAGPSGTGKSAEGLFGQELAMFDQTTGPWYAGKVGEQQDKQRKEQEAYLAKSEEARADGQRRIAEETEKTRADQQAMQEQAQGDVDAERKSWREENRKIQDDYATQSESKRKEVDQQVTEKAVTAEKDADKELTEAETKAEVERKKAEAKAAEEKRKEEQKPRSWWQRVKGAISSVLNAIKKAVNAIFDGLRALVKGIFELAKKLVRGIIELARMAIVGLIKAFGALLKGLVSIALVAFPEAAKKARAWIDKRVGQAVTAVNEAAEMLKKATDAILDFVASTLDSVLGLVQSIQNAILIVVGMIITGEIVELIRHIGYLIDAAKTVPDQFETAALEELLGGNLDEPLSPMELMQAGIIPPHAGPEASGQSATADASQLPIPPWGEHNIGVDEIDHNMELSPELAGDLVEKTQGDGELELASSQDQSRSMGAVMSEVSPTGATKEGATEEVKYPDDGLNPRKRAEIKWQMMKEGISKWWSDKWPTVLAGAAAALLGFIALNIVTGGAITAALPAIMGVIGPLFVGVTVLKLAGNVKDYVSQGWNGQIRPAGKSLAKGLAAGAIELISYLTFKAGGAALKGAKALAKGGVKLAKAGLNLAKAGLKAVARGVKFIIEKGKILFRGISRGFAKTFTSIKNFGEGLLSHLRFRKFRIRRTGLTFTLEGYINPWVPLANFDFGKHLRGLVGAPPKGMIDPHAHHILFKKGLGSAQKELVAEGQAILRKVGIDPIFGKENLIWAPWRISKQHGMESLRKVLEELRVLEKAGADYDDFVLKLKELGQLAATRR